MKPISDSPPSELNSYRSICGLAVLSLVLGGLSVTALSYPGAWVVPLPAIICSLWALRRIRRQPDELVGRRAAWAGLALALFFGAWAPARYATDQWLLHRQARRFVEHWFQLVLEGQLEAAHQATLDFYLRQPEGTALRESYESRPEDLQELQEYFSRGIARDLVDLGSEGQVRFDRNLEIFVDGDARVIAQRYFVYRAAEAEPVVHVQVRTIRDTHEGIVYWTLIGLADAQRIDEELGLP